jgi:hypothetical protein
LFYKSNITLTEISLRDLAGRTLGQQKSPTLSSGSLDLSDLPAGIYFFEATTSKGTKLIRKIIAE